MKNLIECILEEAMSDVNKSLNEAEDDTLSLDDTGTEEGGADDLGDIDGDLDTGAAGDVGGGLDGDLEGGDGTDAGGEDGDLEDGELGDDAGGDDFGGGGGGFGGGGFGGGGGDFGDDGMGDDGESEDADGDGVDDDGAYSEEDLGIPEDPVQSTVQIAVDMLKDTGNDQKILSAVKASIQSNFDNAEDATQVIKNLWDTEHPVLKIVARKLLLFIHGK